MEGAVLGMALSLAPSRALVNGTLSALLFSCGEKHKGNTVSDVALINMPFYTVHAPNLEIGLLKSLLEDLGISTDVKYYNLLYLKETGNYDLYMEIVDSPIEILYCCVRRKI